MIKERKFKKEKKKPNSHIIGVPKEGKTSWGAAAMTQTTAT